MFPGSVVIGSAMASFFKPGLVGMRQFSRNLRRASLQCLFCDVKKPSGRLFVFGSFVADFDKVWYDCFGQIGTDCAVIRNTGRYLSESRVEYFLESDEHKKQKTTWKRAAFVHCLDLGNRICFPARRHGEHRATYI